LVAANVVVRRSYGPLGLVDRKGTKHFRGGAKVLIIDGYGGMCEQVVVIGHHRASQRYAKMVLPARHLENFRAEVTYSPTVIRLVAEHLGPRFSVEDKAAAEKRASIYRAWAQAFQRPPLELHARLAEQRSNGMGYLVAVDGSNWNCEVPLAALPDHLREVGVSLWLRRDSSGVVSFE
jgi:hypothetical protein